MTVSMYSALTGEKMRSGRDKQRCTWLIAFVSMHVRIRGFAHSSLPDRLAHYLTALSDRIVLFDGVIDFQLGWNDAEETCAGGLSRLFTFFTPRTPLLSSHSVSGGGRAAEIRFFFFGVDWRNEEITSEQTEVDNDVFSAVFLWGKSETCQGCALWNGTNLKSLSSLKVNISFF